MQIYRQIKCTQVFRILTASCHPSLIFVHHLAVVDYGWLISNHRLVAQQYFSIHDLGRTKCLVNTCQILLARIVT